MKSGYSGLDAKRRNHLFVLLEDVAGQPLVPNELAARSGYHDDSPRPNREALWKTTWVRFEMKSTACSAVTAPTAQTKTSASGSGIAQQATASANPPAPGLRPIDPKGLSK